jgi:YfiH family protein
MTNLRGVCIGVSTADCIPILLYDSEHHAACAVHAGWRGTVARIAEKAVAAMRNTFASQPEKMCAVIGPGISLQNFEVGDEVYDIFMKQGFSMEKIAERFQKWHIDLPLCNSLQLQSCGIAEERIQMSGICTYDSCHDYFSARRLGINSGRIFTGAVIRP